MKTYILAAAIPVALFAGMLIQNRVSQKQIDEIEFMNSIGHVGGALHTLVNLQDSDQAAITRVQLQTIETGLKDLQDLPDGADSKFKETVGKGMEKETMDKRFAAIDQIFAEDYKLHRVTDLTPEEARELLIRYFSQYHTTRMSGSK